MEKRDLILFNGVYVVTKTVGFYTLTLIGIFKKDKL